MSDYEISELSQTRLRNADVVVVGSGPNGLVAALACARAGLSVAVIEAEQVPGGGCRTLTRSDPAWAGLGCDPCSAVHPLGAVSPAFADVNVEFIDPPVRLAHPLPGQEALLITGPLSELPPELSAWRELISPLVECEQRIVDLVLSDQRSRPHLRTGAILGRAAAKAMLPGGVLHRASTSDSSTLAAGIAAHAICPVRDPAAVGVALVLGMLLHSPSGWPIPRGGSGTITSALLAELERLGATVHTATAVESLDQLSIGRRANQHVVLNTNAQGAATLLHSDSSAGTGPVQDSRAFRSTAGRIPQGNGAAKVDYVLSEDIPWDDPRVANAGTVHLGGHFSEIARAEWAVAHGNPAQKPMVIASQPWAADPSRIAADGRRPLWAYAHVPVGSSQDMTAQVTAAFERVAPGFTDIVVASTCTPANRMAAHNRNLPGGDIAGGSANLHGLIARTTRRFDPFSTSRKNVWIASASTPPGPGVHGMAGLHVARRILKAFGAAS